jgi:hypothetical protein
VLSSGELRAPNLIDHQHEEDLVEFSFVLLSGNKPAKDTFWAWSVAQVFTESALNALSIHFEPCFQVVVIGGLAIRLEVDELMLTSVMMTPVLRKVGLVAIQDMSFHIAVELGGDLGGGDDLVLYSLQSAVMQCALSPSGELNAPVGLSRFTLTKGY